MVATAGTFTTKARGAFWVRYSLTDRNDVVRQYYRPFLAIDRDPDESPLLIGVPGLKEMRVDIYLSNEEMVWTYRLNPNIKIDTRKRF